MLFVTINLEATMLPTPVKDQSGWFFGLGVASILAGLGLFFYFISASVLPFAHNLQQVPVPGEAEISLKGKQDYMVFAQQQSVGNPQIIIKPPDFTGLTCHVHEKATGDEVPLRPMQPNTTYQANGRAGRSVMLLTPPETGAYHFACAYEEGKQGPEGILAVGPNTGLDMAFAMGKGFLSLFVGGVAGAILIVIAYVMRQKAKRQLLQMSPPSA